MRRGAPGRSGPRGVEEGRSGLEVVAMFVVWFRNLTGWYRVSIGFQDVVGDVLVFMEVN